MYIARNRRKIFDISKLTAESIAAATGIAVTAGTLATAGVKKIQQFNKSRKEKQQKQSDHEKLVNDLSAKFDTLLMMVTDTNEGMRKAKDTISETNQLVRKLGESVAIITELDRIDRDKQGIMWYKCDSEGRCVDASDALCNFFGTTHDQMTKPGGNGWLVAIENPQEVYNNWIKSVEDDVPYTAEYFVNNKITKTRTKARTWATKIPTSSIGCIYYGEVEAIEKEG